MKPKVQATSRAYLFRKSELGYQRLGLAISSSPVATLHDLGCNIKVSVATYLPS